jgi:hypothetical protein
MLFLSLFFVGILFNSCGEEKDDGVLCDPSTSTVTTEELEGFWIWEGYNVANNTCSNSSYDEKVIYYLEFVKLNECQIDIRTYKDETFSEYDEEKDLTTDGKLNNDEIYDFKVIRREETIEGSNCYYQVTGTLKIVFSDSDFGVGHFIYDRFVEDNCKDDYWNPDCQIYLTSTLKKVKESK